MENRLSRINNTKGSRFSTAFVVGSVILEFKKFQLDNINIIKPKAILKKSYTCENTVANLSVWYEYYKPEFYIDEENFIVKFDDKNGPLFSIAYFSNMQNTIKMIREYCAEHDIPDRYWIEDGPVFDEFNKYFGDEYFEYEMRNSAEYIYNQSDLANLSGKKYHSKRNHISAFTRNFNWTYEELNDENKADFLGIADAWYSENGIDDSVTLKSEKKALKLLTENADCFDAMGGLVKVDGKTVAITLGAPINDTVFDVIFEKALPEYSGAYAVINNEFAKRIKQPLINREDDMGLDGLRKAKLSYKPCMLVGKHICVPKGLYNSSVNLHIETFDGETHTSADALVSRFIPKCYYRYKDKKIVSQLFLIEGELSGDTVGYIYAAATDKEYRGKGYMAELINRAKIKYPRLALRPAQDSLYEYYERFGFKTSFYNCVIDYKPINTDMQIQIIDDVERFKDIRAGLVPSNSLNLNDKALELVLQNYTVATSVLPYGQNLAVFYKENATLHINEVLGGNKNEFISALIKKFDCKNVQGYTCEQINFNKCGMMYPETHGVNYLGLALD